MALGIRKSAGPGQTNQPQQNNSPLTSVYNAAAETQAQDYDNIMGNYDDILQDNKRQGNTKLNYVPINPVFNRQLQPQQYSRSGEMSTALSGLDEFSRTGGYSDEDISNIRERSISPIRSIYSSAQEGLRRNKVLSGGYSPNYGAVSAKMARDSSSQIGDITTKVNADIAQMIQSGKLSGLNALSSAASSDNALQNTIASRNAQMYNEVEMANAEEERRVASENNKFQLMIDEANARNSQASTNNQLAATQGKQGLYSSTPALTTTFGNQVLANNAQNMQAQQAANTIKNQRVLNPALGTYKSAGPRG